MTEKQTKTAKKRTTANERYLTMVFALLKKRENIIISNKKTRFNDTELRLISEVLACGYRGERLISTQIASRLGVTRSAISQIVNRLEAEGVVRRVPDDKDKKIAYIEVTEDTLAQYKEDIKACGNFVTKVVKKFGEERFEEMHALLTDFIACLEEEKALAEKK